MILNDWVLEEEINKTSELKSKTSENFCSPIVFKNFDDKFSKRCKTINIINSSSDFISETESPLLNISKSDHHLRYEANRAWLQNVERDLASNVLELCISAGYSGYIMSAVWFQQYHKSSNHEWHIHLGNHYSGVYYLEFPEDGPQTEFYNPTSKKMFTLGMQEGDIAIFPSYIPHRSPKNNSNDRKTIISFNIDFAFPDSNQDLINKMIKK